MILITFILYSYILFYFIGTTNFKLNLFYANYTLFYTTICLILFEKCIDLLIALKFEIIRIRIHYTT